MTKWDYGDEGREFPVADGDLWVVDKHLFVCSDLMASGVFDQLVTQHVPSLVYTDPPWGKALLNGFRTKAGLEPADHDWTDLYVAAVAIAHGLPCWLESGRRETEQVWHNVLVGAYRARYEITYYHRSPAVLHYCGPVPPPCDPSGLDDDVTPGFVMKHYDVGCVADPMSGRGGTACNAARQGWRSVNNELNPHRLSAALSRVAKITGVKPEVVNRGLTRVTVQEA